MCRAMENMHDKPFVLPDARFVLQECEKSLICKAFGIKVSLDSVQMPYYSKTF